MTGQTPRPHPKTNDGDGPAITIEDQGIRDVPGRTDWKLHAFVALTWTILAATGAMSMWLLWAVLTEPHFY